MKTIERNITPERATELISHQTEVKDSNGNSFGLFHTSIVSDVRLHMTIEEIKKVQKVWDTLPENSTFMVALQKIAEKKRFIKK